jgi:glutamine---fructose-6-phosphate transaminase (isomerizing)
MERDDRLWRRANHEFLFARQIGKGALVISPSAELMPLGVSHQELVAQPEAVAATLDNEAATIAEVAALIHQRAITRLYLVGCGDSYYTAWAAKYAFESLWRTPCEVVQALEYVDYVAEVSGPDTVVIGLSSSGASRTSVRAIRRAREQGALMIGVTNTQGSPFTTDVDAAILVHATRAGWPTQASTAALASLLLLAVELGRRRRGAMDAELDEVRRQIRDLPGTMAATIAEQEETARDLAVSLADQDNFFFLGAGPSYGTAQFGMAKLKEASQEHSIALELEEYDHIQSFALKEQEPVFLVAPTGRSFGRAREIAAAIVRSHGQLIALADRDDAEIGALASRRFSMPRLDERVSPAVYVLPLQLFAYHLALLRVEHGYQRPLLADHSG